MSFIEKLVGVVTVPKEAFEHIEEGDLRKGILLILVISLLSTWAGATYFSKMEIDLSGLTSRAGPGGPGFFNQGGSTQAPDLEAIRAQMTPLVAAANALAAFTRWLTPSILLVLVAKMLAGEGSAKRLLAMTAFASLPLLLQQILRVIDSMIITSAELKQLAATGLSGTGLVDRFLTQGLRVLNLFGLATLALTVLAIRENYGTATGKASQVVLLAYVGYIIVRMFLPVL
jgi:hypothetical protein